MTQLLITLLLFCITAIAEIVSCYLGYLMLKQHKPLWLIVPMTITLALFVWLLTLHPTATGRVYRDGFGMAKICRWRFSDTLGQRWRFGNIVGRKYYHSAAQNFVINVCNQQIC